MGMKHLLPTLAALFTAPLAALHAAAAFAQKPNVLFILADTKAVQPVRNPDFNPAKYHPEDEGVGKERGEEKAKVTPTAKPSTR